MLGLVVTKAGPTPTPKALVAEITKVYTQREREREREKKKRESITRGGV